MSIRSIAGTLVAITICAPAAHSQDAESGRYTLQKSESGFVRLDRQTGAVTLCIEADGTLTCRMAADERAAYDADLARLEARVDALEKQSDNTAAKAGDLPSDTEIDRSISIMERFMRAFFGLVDEFRDEERKPAVDHT